MTGDVVDQQRPSLECAVKRRVHNLVYRHSNLDAAVAKCTVPTDVFCIDDIAGQVFAIPATSVPEAELRISDATWPGIVELSRKGLSPQGARCP